MRREIDTLLMATRGRGGKLQRRGWRGVRGKENVREWGKGDSDGWGRVSEGERKDEWDRHRYKESRSEHPQDLLLTRDG